jgi:hypothetical protein
MTPEELKTVQYHAQQIAQILYSDTEASEIQTLGEIEVVVRQKILESVSPEIGVFLSKTSPKQQPDDHEKSKRSLGRSASQRSKLRK